MLGDDVESLGIGLVMLLLNRRDDMSIYLLGYVKETWRLAQEKLMEERFIIFLNK